MGKLLPSNCEYYKDNLYSISTGATHYIKLGGDFSAFEISERIVGCLVLQVKK